MAALVAAIHVFFRCMSKDVDGRDSAFAPREHARPSASISRESRYKFNGVHFRGVVNGPGGRSAR